MPDYGALVESIVRRLVKDPDAVKVECTPQGNGVFEVRIRVAPEDIGRVIGKKGATVNALRLLAKAAAVKENEKVVVDILED
ncbi:MAG: KH domain-containing protein [Synergistaceae bacterium]|nr:KH domain-containing protein [Synergistaceae bacterium]